MKKQTKVMWNVGLIGGLLLLLFVLANLIFPLTTPTMIGDFKACGGMLMIANGLRIAGIKNFPIADLIPAMAFVMPITPALAAT